MRYPRGEMEGLTAIVALAETSDMAKAGERAFLKALPKDEEQNRPHNRWQNLLQ